jgi:3-carboxy-cis,cis-muconate cycloisomerase
MGATAIDSAIFRDIFSTPEMRGIFSDQTRIQRYLDIEAALARVQARCGIIPPAAAEEIVRHARVEQFDLAQLKARTEAIGYPVLPVVEQFVAICANRLGEWAHWGATTQDITDTAAVLQVRDALALVDEDLKAISDSLADLAARHRDTPMAGRSNLQHAAPVTFGYKMAVLLAAFDRHRERLRELRPRVLVCEFGGAVGTLASLGARGLEVQAALCQELGLAQPEIAWHTARDGFAEVACFLGLVTGTLGKIATDVKLLMQTEVGEVFEPFAPGRGSSSTMPQKRNPISCNYILACTAVVRQQVAAMLEALVEDHERSTGPWEIEWIALPEIFLLSAGALSQARKLLAGLQVDEKRMRANLGLTGGLIASEAVMMGLAPHIGRQRAHDLVYDLCQQSARTGRPLIEYLAENEEITRYLDRAALARLADPSHYLGLSAEMVERVLSRRAGSEQR